MLFLLESCLPYVPSQILFILPFLTSLLFDLLPKWNSLDGQTYLCRKQSSMSCVTNCCSAMSWVHDHLDIPSDFLTLMSVHPWHGVNPSCCPNTVVSSLLILALQCTSKCSPSHVFSLQIPISLNLTKKVFVSALVLSPSLLHPLFPCFPTSFLLLSSPCFICLKHYCEVIVHVIQSYLPFLLYLLPPISFLNFLFPLEETKQAPHPRLWCLYGIYQLSFLPTPSQFAS